MQGPIVASQEAGSPLVESREQKPFLLHKITWRSPSLPAECMIPITLAMTVASV